MQTGPTLGGLLVGPALTYTSEGTWALARGGNVPPQYEIQNGMFSNLEQSNF